MDYEVTITLRVGITAGSEDEGNEDLAQKRAEQLEAAAIKGVSTVKGAWVGDCESELEVNEA